MYKCIPELYIDDATKVEAWVTYFLNASNHDPLAWDAVTGGTIGFHSYPTNGGYTKDPSTFAGMYAYVDGFVAEVAAVSALAQSLVPGMGITLDESGVDMDGVLEPGSAPQDSPRFWVAGGSYWAYLWAKSVPLGVRVVGHQP